MCTPAAASKSSAYKEKKIETEHSSLSSGLIHHHKLYKKVVFNYKRGEKALPPQTLPKSSSQL